MEKEGDTEKYRLFLLTDGRKGGIIMADNRIAYGLAKKYGIDTKGMSPKEVWDALNEKGVTQQNAEEKYSSDGMGGEHEPTEAEIKRLKELGIGPNKIVFDSEIDKKIIDGIPLSDSEMDKVFESLSKTYERPEKGGGDKNLKKILDLKGFSNPPKKVDKKELTKVLSKGTIMFRGLNGERAKEYAEQFYNGEMYVGIGLGGNGVYMSKDTNEARVYTKGSAVVVSAVMPADMKIAGKEVRKEFNRFSDKHRTTAEHTQTEKERLWKMQHVISFGTYCALKGYDAYIPMISPEKNIVVLNRSKLVIGENNEQERFMELY